MPIDQCLSLREQGATIFEVTGRSPGRHALGWSAARGSSTPHTIHALTEPAGIWRRLGCAVVGIPPRSVDTLFIRATRPCGGGLVHPMQQHKTPQTPVHRLRKWYLSPAVFPSQR